MLTKVLKRFSAISGLNGEKLSKWSFLCTECLNYVLEHTVKDELTQSEENRLTALIATMAYYKLILYDYDEISSFTAGDVHITKQDVQSRAEKAMQAEMNSCCDITDFGSVCFFGVRI